MLFYKVHSPLSARCLLPGEEIFKRFVGERTKLDGRRQTRLRQATGGLP